MDRVSAGVPARAIAGLAALQDLSVLLEGIEDPRSQRPVLRQVLEARRKLLGPKTRRCASSNCSKVARAAALSPRARWVRPRLCRALSVAGSSAPRELRRPL